MWECWNGSEENELWCKLDWPDSKQDLIVGFVLSANFLFHNKVNQLHSTGISWDGIYQLMKFSIMELKV